MERKLKHLEFIQAVINRLSTNSFLLKGWAVVLVSALFALTAYQGKAGYAALAFLPALSFWGLDGYFLGLERAYRDHYDRVRTKNVDDIDFCMSIHGLPAGTRAWAKATFSRTLIPFHGAVVASVVIVMLLQG